MKNIFSIILLGFTVISFAQNGPNRQQLKNQFTPEQQAILQTKQMVMNLDLNDSQKDQLLVINGKRAADRQEMRTKHWDLRQNGTTLTSDERFNMKNEMLDTQIIYQNKLKKVLSTKQFEQWQTTSNYCNYSMSNKQHKSMKKSKMKNKKGGY
jgi:hypothetical protein